jgi:hypothetical protein
MGTDDYVIDFPTLGPLVERWIEHHCVIPDGFHKGTPYVMADWQAWCTYNHYRVREDARWVPDNPVLAPAFHYRRSQVVAPQKTGKGPWAAAVIANEAAGPALFAGWAKRGESYDCEDHGCSCGWYWDYEPGEPKGMPWPTPLIQLTAYSDEQTANVYRPLQSMIKNGRLGELLRIREGFIRLPNDGKIETVTASAMSRLGNPVTFVLHDESQLYNDRNKLHYVSETQRRGLAGMGGRSVETTNCWNPAEASTAQKTYESPSQDIFRFYRKPPVHLSYKNKEDRRRIHRYVYEGSWWVDLDSIEAEAAELMENDPAQAERFYGNRIVQGAGSWLPEGLWEAAERVEVAA